MSKLKPKSKIYKVTPLGLVTEIIEIISCTPNFARSKKRKFHRFYGAGNVRLVGNEDEEGYTSYKIESEALKTQWRKQTLVSQIMMRLDTNIDIKALQYILKLLKTAPK